MESKMNSHHHTKKRLVITGMGSISSAGNSQQLWQKALAGENALSEFEDSLNMLVEKDNDYVVGKVEKDLTSLFSTKVNSFISRNALLAAASIDECLQQNDNLNILDHKTGFLFGSSTGPQDQILNVAKKFLDHVPFSKLNYSMLNSINDGGICSLLASHFGFSGHVHSVNGASCSGMIALETASQLIHSGKCDRVLCTAGEGGLTPATLLFYSKKIRVPRGLTTFFGLIKDREKRSFDTFIRPFANIDESDRGVIGEAGTTLMVESLEAAKERGAHIYGELEYCDFSFYAENYYGKDLELKGLNRVLEGCKDMSLDSIYMAATGFLPMDIGQLQVASKYFKKTHVFTAEPIIGHTAGATTGLNAVLALKSFENETLLGTKNYNPDLQDESCDLRPSSEPLSKKDLNRILILGAGWGGYNGACIVKKYTKGKE